MSSLFIGLGGAGTGVLDYLSKKMDVYNEDLARRVQPQVSAYYYYIDTDNVRYTQHPEEFMPHTNKIFHPLWHHSPEQIRRGIQRFGAEQSLFLTKWYDAPQKRTSLNCGADVIRQYARLAFCYDSSKIRNELIPLIQQVVASQGRIYVITGSCGGTGSGIYMDVLYMISEIYEMLMVPEASADVRLIMVMPEGYILPELISHNVACHKKRLNAFATLEELNAICKDTNSNPSKFNDCYVGPIKKNGAFRPFRFGFLYDSDEQSRDEISQNLSEFLYEWEIAANPNPNVAGITSNFDALLISTTDVNWNYTVNNDYVKAFNAIGRYTIEKPDFLYRQYFTDRMLYDVFHEGLIGKSESVNEDVVFKSKSEFLDDCSIEISKKHEAIKSFMPESVFENDFMVGSLFSVFTGYPNMGESIVKQIVLCKDELLKIMRTKVSEYCKKWMKQYNFTTTYTILDALDAYFYAASLQTYHEFDDLLAKAKKNSMGGLLKKRIKPEKAKNEFEHLLHTWLTFEVIKALSSGVDISDKEHGYLDYGKVYVSYVRHNLQVDNVQEHWETQFCKKVARLKYSENRSFAPTLDTITDDNHRVIPNCPIVMVYENMVQADSANTLQMLHERIMTELMTDASLKEQGFDLDEFLDPTPSKHHSKASLFVEKYVAVAKEQINLLLEANNSYQQLFADDIMTRLQNLPMSERARICRSFADYDRVQLKTQPMSVHDLASFTYYLISSGGNVGLMQELGILDQNGKRKDFTDYTDEPYFGDKIVKLIVKNGYSVDDYRYFEEYKRYQEEMTIDSHSHYNPFIDKRFLGEPDADGKYSCDVSAALEKIEKASLYSLEGYDDAEIYKYCLALLYEYYDALEQGENLEPDLKGAIGHSAMSLNIQQLKYTKSRRNYYLDSEDIITINLDTLSDINNIYDLTMWIRYILSKKNYIKNECELYGKALDDFMLSLSDNLLFLVGKMMGEGDKPLYDFFVAYLDWYRNRLG